MTLKNLDKVNNAFIALCSLSFWILVVFGIMMIRDAPDGGTLDKWYEVGAIVCVFMIFALLLCIDRAGSRLGWMRKYLDLDNLGETINLPPTQLEKVCIARIQVLADELIAAEEAHKNPLARERTMARWNMQRAYWFFVDHGYMQQVPWENFFKAAV